MKIGLKVFDCLMIDIMISARGLYMKLFTVIMYMSDEQKSLEYRSQHLDYLALLKNEDRIFAHGRFVDGSGGLQIYQGNSLEEVQLCVERDPFVVSGARTFKIHELQMNYIKPQL
jgi:uncharacterized protein YciI